jgi:ribonuclease T2
MKRVTGALLLILLITGMATAKKRKPVASSKTQFDYYLLSLSWAPDYCAGHPSDRSSECRAGKHTAFVLHGLWPQANSGPPPMACRNASPVSSATTRKMAQFFPSPTLIAHEWQKHGTCSGLSADEYFDKVTQAFTAVKVPDEFKNLGDDQKFPVEQIESNFAQANGAPKEAFRISCHAGEVVSVEACLTKDLQYQPCSQSVSECQSKQVLMRAIR